MSVQERATYERYKCLSGYVQIGHWRSHIARIRGQYHKYQRQPLIDIGFTTEQQWSCMRCSIQIKDRASVLTAPVQGNLLITIDPERCVWRKSRRPYNGFGGAYKVITNKENWLHSIRQALSNNGNKIIFMSNLSALPPSYDDIYTQFQPNCDAYPSFHVQLAAPEHILKLCGENSKLAEVKITWITIFIRW